MQLCGLYDVLATIAQYDRGEAHIQILLSAHRKGKVAPEQHYEYRYNIAKR